MRLGIFTDGIIIIWFCLLIFKEKSWTIKLSPGINCLIEFTLIVWHYMVFFFVVGRVCVPIDPNRCDEFDPTTVPTLSQVNLFCNDNFLTCIQGRGKLSTGSVICVFFMREVPIYYLTVFGTCIVKLAPFSNTFSCGKRKYHLLTWLKWGYKVYACISPLHLQFCTIIFFFWTLFVSESCLILSCMWRCSW